jgi:hypothetical protein
LASTSETGAASSSAVSTRRETFITFMRAATG